MAHLLLPVPSLLKYNLMEGLQTHWWEVGHIRILPRRQPPLLLMVVWREQRNKRMRERETTWCQRKQVLTRWWRVRRPPASRARPTQGGVTGRSAQPDARPVGIDLQDPRLRLKDRRHAGAKGSKTKWKERDRECAVRTLKITRKNVRAGTPRGATSP